MPNNADQNAKHFYYSDTEVCALNHSLLLHVEILTAYVPHGPHLHWDVPRLVLITLK